MKHTVSERTELIERREYWNGTFNGFDFCIFKREDGVVSLSIADYGEPSDCRLGILEWYPKSVAAIERFSQIGGGILAQIAKEMRAAGLDDLRSTWDVRRDEMEAKFKKIQTSGSMDVSLGGSSPKVNP